MMSSHKLVGGQSVQHHTFKWFQIMKKSLRFSLLRYMSDTPAPVCQLMSEDKVLMCDNMRSRSEYLRVYLFCAVTRTVQRTFWNIFVNTGFVWDSTKKYIIVFSILPARCILYSPTDSDSV